MSIKSYFLSSKNNDEERAIKKIKLNPSNNAKEDTSLAVVSLTGNNLEENTSDQKIKEILKEETKEGCSVVWNPFSELSGDWRDELIKEVNKTYFVKLTSFLATEIRSKKVYPECNQLFTAFNLCQLSSLKVVIIGQDPYHGRGQAHGLAFSVQKGIAMPPSLKNIFKEAMTDVRIPSPKHGNLEHWAKQGVLLLNTCLTVRDGEANSHQNRGWEEFTDAVIKLLASKDSIVYLLWGNPAQTKCKSINTSKNVVIMSSHPSPLGAHKTTSPFIGSKCFSRCNAALEKYGKSPIDWSIPS